MQKYYEKAKKIFSRRPNSNGDLNLGIDIRRDWRIMTIFFLLLVSVILLLDIKMFVGDRDDGLTVDTGLADPLALDRVKLSNTVRVWQERELRFNRVMEEKEAVVDPSL